MIDEVEKFLSWLPGGGCFECRGLYIYLLIIVLFIYLYVVFMMAAYGDTGQVESDRLNIVLIEDTPIGPIGGWPLSHFLAFFVAGLLFPDCFVLAMGLGVAWEVYETIAGNLFYGDRPATEGQLYNGKWMQGRVEDIIFDFLGFVFGMWIARAFWAKPKCVVRSTDVL